MSTDSVGGDLTLEHVRDRFVDSTKVLDDLGARAKQFASAAAQHAQSAETLATTAAGLAEIAGEMRSVSVTLAEACSGLAHAEALISQLAEQTAAGLTASEFGRLQAAIASVEQRLSALGERVGQSVGAQRIASDSLDARLAGLGEASALAAQVASLEAILAKVKENVAERHLRKAGIDL